MEIAYGLIGLAAALSIALSAIAVAIGQGKVATTAIDSMTKQPEMAGQIRTTMILAMGLMEALAIYGLLIAFILAGKIS